MKNSIFKGKSTHTKIYSAITIVGIVLLLALNLIVTRFCESRAAYLDLTPEGFYSLSDKMLETCHEILDPDEDGNKKQIKITFCTDPDYLISDDDLRPSYFMALELANEFDNVTVETVNVTYNPTAVNMYTTTWRDVINPTDMIVSYGAKYRIVDATSLWTSNYFSYDGEYRMASMLMSLTAINKPVAYFTCGNGETYYDPEHPESQGSEKTRVLYELLTDRGLTVKTIDLTLGEVTGVPEDCALLIINNPTVDFTADEDKLGTYGYVSPLEKIDRYLVGEYGAVMLNKAYDIDLPNLENLAAEWGIGFGDSKVYDNNNALYTTLGEESNASIFTGTYDTEETSYGYAYYSAYSSLSSAPQMVFSNTGYVKTAFSGGAEEMIEMGNSGEVIRSYASFIGTSDEAFYEIPRVDESGNNVTVTVPGKYSLAAAGVRTRLDGYTNQTTYSYFFCTNSADFLSNELLGNSAYANYNVMAAVISNISRTESNAPIELGGETLNSPTPGGKQTQDMTLYDTVKKVFSPDGSEMLKENKAFTAAPMLIFTVLVMLPAIGVFISGTVIFIKRKFL